MRQIKKGSTDQSVIVRVVDSSDGTPETGVAYNTSGVDLWYRREGGLKVSLTEATLATADAAHSDGGFLHVGDGYCRLDLPDAACASGANGVLVGGTFTGMVVIGCYVHLVDYDPQDMTRLGLTGAPLITYTGPAVNEDATIEIVRGDDYKITDNRQFTFTIGASPDLTGATVVLKIRYGDDGDSEYVSGACTLSGTGTSTQTIKAELTAAQTVLLIPVTYDGDTADRRYDLEATLSNGNVATLVQGVAVVSKDAR
jgi:hypothetical protein